ncbi:MAG TPA: hypothetical protein VF668_13145 [Pyrinomonadaceae bacterium]
MRRLLLAAAAAAALSAPAAMPEARADGPAAAHKVDEFGRVGGCDHSARLDHFAIELQNNPAATGFIIAYGPDGQGSGTADYRLKITKQYLVTARDVEPGRLKTVYGGPYREKGEAWVEFWLVPPGAAEPRPAKYENDAGSFKGKFAEYKAYDEVSGWDMGTGPPVGNSTLAGFAEALRMQPKAAGYVVAYSGEDAAPGAWRRVGQSEADGLRAYGVEPDRVKVLFGGYRKEITVRLWVLPADAPPPVKGDAKERRPEAAAEIGRFDEYYLKYAENERRVFRGFAEVLKADEDLNVCVVVRPGLAGEKEFDPESKPDPDEPPAVDVLKLAEAWRARLAKEYGVGSHRLIILVASPAEGQTYGEVQTWVVPPGAALPDTSDEAGDEGEAEGEENPKEF